ncbi:unnamed protein product [Adineta ricciae]|uniref:Uncharacterized protein n=1 Tax=Adineta ricciae TaxID=249248 RepID=A0A816HFE9_ADIRI|nr:unnamed protein product [Adineta ricciae]
MKICIFPDLRNITALKSPYPWLMWMVVALGVSSVLFWIAQHMFSSIKWLRRVDVPVSFIYMISLTEPTYGYVIAPGWIFLGIIFRKVVHRWWFDRYAFLFQIGMFMGTSAAAYCIFFIFTYNGIAFPNWWGTQMDFCRLAYANVDGKILDH